MTPTLQMTGVTRVFGEGRLEVDAVTDVSLSAAAGELVAVMGPSGSGKTTLLSLAGGLDHPSSGTVSVEGIDLSDLSRADLARMRRRSIGYVFQQMNLVEGLTAIENASLPLELDGRGRRDAREAAASALELVSMGELADRFPDELSGGEQQRVAIARAVVGDRVLLLADEPTGALDSVTGESVLRLLRGHCDRGGAGVLVTHDARFAAWADRIVFLRDGRIVDETQPTQGPETLLRDPVSR
ncbi:MAG: ABC transporter ATP-binding protein [Actinomycetota bacterium]|nr:ABC transporter ATP-binding protein [Actinomycetota bacterium]